MSARLLRRLVALYPAPWRRRYGAELRDLIDELVARGERSRGRVALELLAGAAGEWWRRMHWAVAVGLAVCVAAVVSVAAITSGGPAPHTRAAAQAPATHGPRRHAPSITVPQPQSQTCSADLATPCAHGGCTVLVGGATQDTMLLLSPPPGHRRECASGRPVRPHPIYVGER